MEFAELLQNPTILQALNTVGGGLGKGNPVVDALSGMVQQNIQTQNYSKLMKQLLGPDGSKGTFDASGLTLKIPPTDPALKGFLGGGEGQVNTSALSSFVPMQSSDQPTSQQTAQGGSPTLINPFAGDQQGGGFNPTASDLAGLSPEHLNALVGIMQSQSQLKSKSYSDMVDSIYKGALTEEAKARTKDIPLDTELAMMKATAEAAQDRPFPVKVPGVGQVSGRQWSSMPESDRSYALYAHGAETLGQKPMSKDEWDTVKPTERERFLSAVMKDPKLKKTALELARAGATNISLDTKLAEKKAMSELEGQTYFNDPKWTNELNKYMEGEEVQDVLFRSKQPKVDKARETIKFVEDKIVGGGGSIIDTKVTPEGIGEWTVRWPNGDRKVIRYKVK